MRLAGYYAGIQTTISTAWLKRRDGGHWTPSTFVPGLPGGAEASPYGTQTVEQKRAILEMMFGAATGQIPCGDCGQMMQKNQVHRCYGRA